MADRKVFNPDILIIAQKVRQLRKENGWTSYESFAWDNNLSPRQYWRLEKGTNFTIEFLIKVLNIHNISLKEFMLKAFNE